MRTYGIHRIPGPEHSVHGAVYAGGVILRTQGIIPDSWYVTYTVLIRSQRPVGASTRFQIYVTVLACSGFCCFCHDDSDVMEAVAIL